MDELQVRTFPIQDDAVGIAKRGLPELPPAELDVEQRDRIVVFAYRSGDDDPVLG